MNKKDPYGTRSRFFYFLLYTAEKIKRIELRKQKNLCSAYFEKVLLLFIRLKLFIRQRGLGQPLLRMQCDVAFFASWEDILAGSFRNKIKMVSAALEVSYQVDIDIGALRFTFPLL